MKLVSRTDIDLSAAALFPVLTDAAFFEAMAARKGVRVKRLDDNPEVVAGSAWRIHLPYRGRERLITHRVQRIDEPRRLLLVGNSGSFRFEIEALLSPMARDSTRLAISLDVRPETFGARILLQTLKLGKGRLQARFDQRLLQAAQVLAQRAGAMQLRGA